LNFINPKQSYDPLATLETYTDVTDLAKTLIPISSDIKEPYFVKVLKIFWRVPVGNLKAKNRLVKLLNF